MRILGVKMTRLTNSRGEGAAALRSCHRPCCCCCRTAAKALALVWLARPAAHARPRAAAPPSSAGFVVEMSAATVVMLGSRCGLPISTTHCLVGAVSGIGAQLWRGVTLLCCVPGASCRQLPAMPQPHPPPPPLTRAQACWRAAGASTGTSSSASSWAGAPRWCARASCRRSSPRRVRQAAGGSQGWGSAGGCRHACAPTATLFCTYDAALRHAGPGVPPAT